MFDLERLSPEQREVVLADDRPLLVIAGPGSGKTTTLAARIAYLVEVRGFVPAGVLAITFTTAAAQALRGRLVAMLGQAGSLVDVTTFHAFGLRLVHHWSEFLGFRPGGPAVCSGATARALLREAAAGEGVDLERTPLGPLAAQVERWRLSNGTSRGAGAGPTLLVRQVASAYESLLSQADSVDYPGMLALPLRLFGKRPATLRFCQDAYRTVLADEFQDLCFAQYTLVRLLAERHRSVVVVGDPRQTLYRWRGADIRYFGQFRHDFPEARVLSLEQNFRSTQRLVELANELGRDLGHERGLWTDNPLGQAALLYAAEDETDEASFVAEEIARLCAGGAIAHHDEVAVLYRTNRQAQAVSRALRERGIPCAPPERGDPAGDLFAARPDHPDQGLTSDLDCVLADGDPSLHPREPRDIRGVVLTTIHASKGCEWRVVFVVGVEDGLLPHARAIAGETEDVDDELRVAYVAVTRPRERLYLTYCRSRAKGQWRQSRRLSRFLAAVPDPLIAPAPLAPSAPLAPPESPTPPADSAA